MAAFALVVHRQRGEAVRVARETATWLSERGHEVRLPLDDAGLVDVPECGVEAEKLAAGLDLAISLGGDGTMLRAVELVSREGVPVLGVNVGRLGYLTHLEAAQVPAALELFLGGAYQVEERMTLAVEVEAQSSDVPARALWALNEAVIEKASAG